MKIVKDCWEKLGVSECQYGAHVFNGVDAVVYVNHWLAAFAGLDQLFSRKTQKGLLVIVNWCFVGLSVLI